MKTLRVVAAVICDSIEHKTKIFSTARGYGEFKGGWEFPGGKIEAGETPQQAVVREIREELDATVKEQTEMLNGGKLYEDYQEVCIKNSKLNATVDVLVEKISMLKAVGCHG